MRPVPSASHGSQAISPHLHLHFIFAVNIYVRSQVRDRLVAACLKHGVQIRYGASLESLTRVESPPGACITSSFMSDLHSSDPGYEPQSSDSNGSSSSSGGALKGGGSQGLVDLVTQRDSGGAWVCGLQDGTQIRAQRLILAADRLILLQPTDWLEYRDRGLALAAQGEVARAVSDLEKYLFHAEHAPDVSAVAQRLAELRRATN